MTLSELASVLDEAARLLRLLDGAHAAPAVEAAPPRPFAEVAAELVSLLGVTNAAREVGCNANSMSRWAAGKTQPSPPKQAALEAALRRVRGIASAPAV